MSDLAYRVRFPWLGGICEESLIRLHDSNKRAPRTLAGPLLSGGRARDFADSSGEIINLFNLLEPDVQDINTAKAQDITRRLITFFFVVAQTALADDLHADDAFAGSVQLFQDRRHLLWRAIHAHAV